MRKSFDEVCAPELCGVASRLTRRDLNQALDHESRLRAAGAAIGVDRRGVGVDPVDLAVDVGDPILSRQQRRVEICWHGGSERREIGAEIGGRVNAEPRYFAAGVQREFGVRNVVAPMRVGEKSLGAIGGPFHRPVDLLGRPYADGFIGVNEDLRAESAADVWRDDPQLVLWRKTDKCRQDHPRNMRVLARRIERHRVRPEIVVAHGGARLHCVRDQAVVDEVELGHVLRGGEGRIGRRFVADVPIVDGVARRGVMDLRLT